MRCQSRSRSSGQRFQQDQVPLARRQRGDAKQRQARPARAARERRRIGARQHDADPRRRHLVGGEVARGLRAGHDHAARQRQEPTLDPGQRLHLLGRKPGLERQRVMHQRDPGSRQPGRAGRRTRAAPGRRSPAGRRPWPRARQRRPRMPRRRPAGSGRPARARSPPCPARAAPRRSACRRDSRRCAGRAARGRRSAPASCEPVAWSRSSPRRRAIRRASP